MCHFWKKVLLQTMMIFGRFQDFSFEKFISLLCCVPLSLLIGFQDYFFEVDNSACTCAFPIFPSTNNGAVPSCETTNKRE
jgi:hypothetical protein